MRKTSTIHFYQMQLEEILKGTNKDGTPKTKTLPTSQLMNELIRIINAKKNKYNTLSFGSDEYSLEIISCGEMINDITSVTKDLNNKSKLIFGKMGKRKDILNYQKRNQTTLEPNKIQKTVYEYFEAFTYFYLFKETINNEEPYDVVTIAFLMSSGAPRIRTMSSLSEYLKDPQHMIKITPITTEDGLKQALSKDIFNGIEYSLSLPVDDELAKEVFGLNEDKFDKLRSLKSLDINLKLVGDRGANILEDKQLVNKMVSNMKEFASKRKGSNMNIYSKAKNENETMMRYDFLDNILVAKETFIIESDINWEDIVKVKMHAKYLENRPQIRNYVR